MTVFVYDFLSQVWSGIWNDIGYIDGVFFRGLARLAFGAINLGIIAVLALNIFSAGHLTLWLLGILLAIEIICQIGNAG
jgi:hypothetical protein